MDLEENYWLRIWNKDRMQLKAESRQIKKFTIPKKSDLEK